MLTLKRFGLTTVLVASMAMPATATAQGQDLRNPDRRTPAPAQGQDLRNADRRAPATVAAAPVEVPAVTTIQAPAQGFDWGDAAIGAAGAIAPLSTLIGLTLAASQRRRGAGIPA